MISDSAVGPRIDIAVQQELDFPTVYHLQRQLTAVRDSSTEYQYRYGRQQLLLATKQTCIRLIYGNALVALRIVFVVKRCHRRSGFCTDIIINLEWTHFRIKLQHRLVVILPNLSFLLALDCN